MCSALQPVSTQRRVAAAAKSGGLDVQLSWPYGLLLAEVACVATQARTPLAVLSILLVILQTPQDNYLLKQLSNSSTFGRYKDAKTFLNVFTVFTFGAFLACSFVMSKSG